MATPLPIHHLLTSDSHNRFFVFLLVSPQHRHGSYDLGSGIRSVLVGTLSVKPSTQWQRFVSMWRLWGLFSRRVRYIADVGLLAYGAPVEEEVVLEERGLDADGNDPLEF